MTCQELGTLWPEQYPRPSATSNRQYGYIARAWGEDNVGVNLAEYTREMAREYSLRHPSRIKPLRAMFNDALRDGLVSSNPFAALRITKPRRERYFPSTEEVEDLIRAAEEPLRGRVRFSAYTGLRLGEVLAVRPMDFEQGGGDASARWDRRLCRSESESTRVAGSGVGNGFRPATFGMRVRVRTQINPQGEPMPRKGKVKDYWALVPPNGREGLGPMVTPSEEHRLWPLTRAEHNKEWNTLRKRLKLPDNFVWHSLRHHAATWFLDQGASFEDVAVQLGHSDEGVIVREVYGHRDRGKALDRLEELVS